MLPGSAPGSVPSTTSPTGRPGGRVALNWARKPRAPWAPNDSSGGRLSPASVLSTMRTSGCRRTISPSLHCSATPGPVNRKPSRPRLTTSSQMLR